jgi:glucose dehydrogenase
MTESLQAGVVGPERLSAIAFMVTGVVFMLVALLSDVGGETAFLIMGLVFVAVSLNMWRSSRPESE